MLPEYLKYWGLTRPPFSLTPDPEMLYMSRQHQEGLIRLKYAVVSNKGGALLISENAGDGKTSLLARLRRELDDYYQGNCRMVFIDHPTLTANQMVGEIARQLGVGGNSTDKLSLLNDLRAFLLKSHEQGEKCVVMLDEGQMLCHRPDLLQELRILLNFCVSDAFLLTFILSGQKPLDEAIRSMPEFYQRLPVRFFLRNLDMDDTRELIRHRLKMAGCPPTKELLSDDGYAGIYNHSKGCPRVICSVADLALVIAHSNFSNQVDFVAVSQATSDMNRTDGAYHYFHFLNSFKQTGPVGDDTTLPLDTPGAICTSCGGMNLPGANFCTHCGVPLAETIAPPPKQVQDATPEIPEPPAQEINQPAAVEDEPAPAPEPVSRSIEEAVLPTEEIPLAEESPDEVAGEQQLVAPPESEAEAPEIPEENIPEDKIEESPAGPLPFTIMESEYQDPGSKLQQALKFILEGEERGLSVPESDEETAEDEPLSDSLSVEQDVPAELVEAAGAEDNEPEAEEASPSLELSNLPPQPEQEEATGLEEEPEAEEASPSLELSNLPPQPEQEEATGLEEEEPAEIEQEVFEEPEEEVPTTIKCSFCGLELDSETIECPNCGECLRPEAKAKAGDSDEDAAGNESSAEDILLDGIRELKLEKYIPAGPMVENNGPLEMLHLPRPRFFGRSAVVQFAIKEDNKGFTARCGLKVSSDALLLEMGRDSDRLEYSGVEEIATDAVSGNGSALLGQLVITAAEGTYRLTLPFNAEIGGRLAGLLQNYISGKISADSAGNNVESEETADGNGSL